MKSISHSDLRDHATEDRIDRIWNRIDADLPAAPVSQLTSIPTSIPTPNPVAMRDGHSATGRWSSVLVAVAASLAAGLLVGKIIWDRPALVEMAETSVIPAVEIAQAQNQTQYQIHEIYAAGVRARSYPLPGGGQVVLSHSTMLEVVSEQADTIELRLVQGEATIDASEVSSNNRVVVLSGEASLVTQGGGVVHVKRNDEVLEVYVTNGTASVRSPSGEHSLSKGDSVHAALLHQAKPVDSVSVAHVPTRLRLAARSTAAAEQETPRPAMQDSKPDWKTKKEAGDIQGAFISLQSQPGGIDAAIFAATDTDGLWAVYDVARGRDVAAAFRALERVVNAFPNDDSTQTAAYKLSRYYRSIGQSELAERWSALAAAASPDGELTEDALCEQFRSAPNESSAKRHAQEYLVKYPNGRCKADAQRLISGESSENNDPTTGPSDDEQASDTPPS